MLTVNRTARLIPIAAFVVAAFVACSDNTPSTAPKALQPKLTQVAASPVVNSLSDPGDGTCDDTECTLREAIDFASGGATITFAPALTGTITLASTSGNLYMIRSVTISGPGADVLAVSGNDSTRVFWVVGGNSTISGLTITHGRTPYVGGGGIAVGNGGTTLTLKNCALTNNSLTYGSESGGAIANSGATLIISSCTFSGNSGRGSAIDASARTGTEPGYTRIVNSTISGNGVGSHIEAVYVNAGTTMLIDHTTITGNDYGVYSASTAPAVSVKGSMIWGNNDADVGQHDANGFTSLGYNLIGKGDGTINITTVFNVTGDQTGVADAKIGALALNSPGTMQTHALLEGSPAIDAGVCTDIAGSTLSTDQRGVSRPQGSTCDIGAYELTGALATPTFVFSLATLPAHTYGDSPFSVASYATTNSTGAITFATGATSVGCSVSSVGLVTITGAAIDGTQACFIEASLAPDATYTGAGPIPQSFQIARAAGSVSINNIPSSAAVGGSFTPAYTKLGDGTASTVSNSTGVCTVSSGVVNYIAAGTCRLQASVTQGTNHLAVTGSEQSFTVSLTTPTFTFNLGALPSKTFGDGNFSVTSYVTTNSSGTVSYATGTGSVGCSVNSTGTVTIDGAAVDPNACIIEATLASDGTYAGAGPVSQSFHIAKAAGSVSINNVPASGIVGGSFTPTYTKLGDGTASTVSNSTGVCTVTSGVVNYIAAGTCRLQASVTAGTNHLAATGTEQTFNILLVVPTFAFNLSALPAKTYGDGSFSVAGYATTNSTGAVTFALGSGSVGCSVSSAGLVTINGAAIDPSHCVIAATLAPSGAYAGAGPLEQSFNIAKRAGSVSISNIPGSATVGGNFTPTYTKLGDGTASVVSNSTGICTVSSGVVNFIAAGSCLLQASVTEGSNYLAATGTEQSFTVSLTAPTFTFNLGALPAKTFGDGNFSVTSYVTTNSSGTVSFATGTGSVGCSVNGTGTVTITGAAVDPNACIIEATLASDGTYSGAGPISQSFNIAKAAGSVSIGNLPSSGIVGGSFTPTYSKLGDGTASTVSNSTGVCTVSSGVVNYIGAGTCRLQASVTAGTNYLAATGSEQTFSVLLVVPTFSFNLSTLPAKTYGNGSFSVAGYATTNSTGAITFTLGSGSVGCSVSSVGLVTINGAAVDPSHCVIAATLAPSGAYAGAGPIEQSFNIAKAAGSVTITNMPTSATVGGQFTPTFSKSGNGTASVASLTTAVCTVSAGVVNFIAAGNCALQASVTEGTNYLAATGSEQSVNVVSGTGVFASACTYTINAKNNQRQVTVSWENANPGVTQIQINDGKGVTKQLAPTTAGSWSTNVKSGVPVYGLWGGASRRDFATNLVPAGSACTLQ